MSDARLQAILRIIQDDVGGRGLRSDPHDNLITACPDDFEAACRSLAEQPNLAVGILTGFLIPTAEPPSGETDGPLGALFLARAVVALGGRAALLTDSFCRHALEAGLQACGLVRQVSVMTPPTAVPGFGMTHLVSLERVGPSYTPEILQTRPGATEDVLRRFRDEVPPEHFDRCHTMRGRDITASMAPAHQLVEALSGSGVTTIGIGDGGNEIGMGKIPWDTICRNIPGGGVVACRVPTDYLVVCGVSNWGAYGLAAGLTLLKGQKLPAELFDLARERELLRVMVEQGPLVDGVTGKPTVSVDGLSFERYSEPLVKIWNACS